MAKFLFYDDKIINILVRDEKPSGGAAVQAYGWIRGLKETGQDICVITNTSLSEPLKAECQDITLIPLYDKKKGIRWARWLYYRLPYIYSKIKEARPNYLYQGIPSWTSFFLGSICRILNIKYVLRISNDYLLDDRFYKNYSRTHRFFQKQGMKLAHCILCQNDYQLSIVKKEFPDKIAIKISNPFFLKSLPNKIDIHSRKYIAWLGLYQYQKNLQLLYEIASELKNETFHIAGKESSKCDEETFYFLDRLKELPNVKFVGFLQRDQVLPFLASAKFLLNTSRYEGFSNTFLEAMSVRTPILTSKSVNPDSIITKYNLGVVYADLSDLKNQYSSITPKAYEDMTNSVLDYVMQHHEYRNLAKKLMNFLNNN